MSPREHASSMIRRAAAAFAWVENAAITLLAAALVLLAGGQIVARIAFDSGWSEIDDALRAMVLWIALIGAMIAAREDRHLAIDALSRFVRGPASRVVRFATYAAAAGISGLIAWHAFKLVRDEFTSGTIAFAAVPAWFVQSIMPIAFGVIALRFVRLAFAEPRPESAIAHAPVPHDDAGTERNA